MSEPFLSPHWHRVAGLRPRLHDHVVMHRHRYRGTTWYVAQDHLSGRHHRLAAAVYLFVGLLDGCRTIDETWQLVVERLGNSAPTQDAVIRILAKLHGADLMHSDMPPSIIALLERHDRVRRAELRRRYGNPLSLKLPLLDPDRFLQRTIGLVRPVMKPAGAAFWICLVSSALLQVSMHWKELSNDFADQVLARENLIAMALVYPLTKLLHELGHAYAVKRFGGAVHELGLMIMLFLPLPYVDASAAASYRSKWARVFVGAAGMMTECLLASLAMFVWLVSEPGQTRSLAYAVMITAGLSTIVFNINPLMRMDGYYILGDLIEVPNLAERSAAFWRRLVERTCFGLPETNGQIIAQGNERLWCIAYAPASLICRSYVTLGIAAFFASRFFFVGVAIAAWALCTIVIWPLLLGAKYILTAPSLERRRTRALIAVSMIAALVVGVLFAVPVPLSSTAEGVVWLPDNSIVRASEDGFIDALPTRPGDQAATGQILFALRNGDLEQKLAVLVAENKGLQARFESERMVDRVQAKLTGEAVAVKQADLSRLRHRLTLLHVRSDADGLFVVARADGLVGRFVKRGDVMGFVVPQGGSLIRAAVTQANVGLVRHRMVSAMLLPSDPAEPRRNASILREVPGGSRYLPSPALGDAGGGRLASDPRDKHRTLTLQRTFQFDLGLAATDRLPNYGDRVIVRFNHGREAVAFQLYRKFRQLVLARFDA